MYIPRDAEREIFVAFGLAMRELLRIGPILSQSNQRRFDEIHLVS
jgi:hypothetical protein